MAFRASLFLSYGAAKDFVGANPNDPLSYAKVPIKAHVNKGLVLRLRTIAKAAARLDLDVSAGWASPSSHGLCGVATLCCSPPLSSSKHRQAAIPPPPQPNSTMCTPGGVAGVGVRVAGGGAHRLLQVADAKAAGDEQGGPELQARVQEHGAVRQPLRPAQRRPVRGPLPLPPTSPTSYSRLLLHTDNGPRGTMDS
jgi:hypothetical protein